VSAAVVAEFLGGTNGQDEQPSHVGDALPPVYYRARCERMRRKKPITSLRKDRWRDHFRLRQTERCEKRSVEP
jgi:hypothetical protein